jgi:hypothetical protein
VSVNVCFISEYQITQPLSDILVNGQVVTGRNVALLLNVMCDELLPAEGRESLGISNDTFSQTSFVEKKDPLDNIIGECIGTLLCFQV